MNFGGPVWHVSVSHPRRSVRRKAASKALRGVGSSYLGEWCEESLTGRPIYHIRRRLTPAEVELVGPVVDVRGTEEAEIRAARVLDTLKGCPHFYPVQRMVAEELAG